jgi:hypothetical protein
MSNETKPIQKYKSAVGQMPRFFSSEWDQKCRCNLTDDGREIFFDLTPQSEFFNCKKIAKNNEKVY